MATCNRVFMVENIGHSPGRIYAIFTTKKLAAQCVDQLEAATGDSFLVVPQVVLDRCPPLIMEAANDRSGYAPSDCARSCQGWKDPPMKPILNFGFGFTMGFVLGELAWLIVKELCR